MHNNENKSSVVFNGISDEGKAQVLNLLIFQEAYLPVRYLGVPLILRRLKKEHCSGLVDKILARIAS